MYFLVVGSFSWLCDVSNFVGFGPELKVPMVVEGNCFRMAVDDGFEKVYFELWEFLAEQYWS